MLSSTEQQIGLGGCRSTLLGHGCTVAVAVYYDMKLSREPHKVVSPAGSGPEFDILCFNWLWFLHPPLFKWLYCVFVCLITQRRCSDPSLQQIICWLQMNPSHTTSHQITITLKKSSCTSLWCLVIKWQKENKTYWPVVSWVQQLCHFVPNSKTGAIWIFCIVFFWQLRLMGIIIFRAICQAKNMISGKKKKNVDAVIGNKSCYTNLYHH